ncbi:DNA mismatch repair protein (plasmid) [Fulvitalea axinellae]|uniref:DNA mismatch repair protein n=1 Tax=Fulvitalea axinellae TaxID=1182444 RepID=A0AAU9CYA0_9BACT|nr:DNA mismatch repair protein [Fulvitalea axinellae]
MSKDVSEIFQEREAHFRGLFQNELKRYRILSTARLVWFSIAIVLEVYLANIKNGEAMWMTGLVFVCVFVVLIIWHRRTVKRKEFYRCLAEINAEELRRISGDLKGLDGGDEFTDPAHAYVADLDIFGNNSLYALVNRAHTEEGRRVMATWLSAPADRDTVQARQLAVLELGERMEWRQELQAKGRMSAGKQNTDDRLYEWLESDSYIMPGGKFYYLFFLLSLALITSLALAFFDIIPLGISGLLAIVNTLYLLSLQKAVKTVTDGSEKSLKSLAGYESLIKHIETQRFKTETLEELARTFDLEGTKASEAVEKLNKILFALNSRANIFYPAMDILFLLDLYWLIKAVRWRKKYGSSIRSWFEAVGNIEALASISGFSAANPAYRFPKVTDERYAFEAESLGHPLIPSDRRVTNDFGLSGDGSVCLVTGSNMSGKSTFLRTVGVNAVLALGGAPVCADSMRISVMQVYTGMRTSDSLEENVSSFYAELRRIRGLLDRLGEGVPVFFMLDEILKGTNSKDRHAGAAALIRQLNRNGCTGMVSTHDLELGQMAVESSYLKNFHFSSDIDGDEINFDYKLKEGICKSFNASKLMERMGIEMNA